MTDLTELIFRLCIPRCLRLNTKYIQIAKWGHIAHKQVHITL